MFLNRIETIFVSVGDEEFSLPNASEKSDSQTSFPGEKTC